MSAHRSIDGSGGCEEIKHHVVVGELLYFCGLCYPPLVLDVTNFSLYIGTQPLVFCFMCGSFGDFDNPCSSFLVY